MEQSPNWTSCQKKSTSYQTERLITGWVPNFHSSVVEESALLGCDFTLRGKLFRKFLRQICFRLMECRGRGGGIILFGTQHFVKGASCIVSVLRSLLLKAVLNQLNSSHAATSYFSKIYCYISIFLPLVQIFSKWNSVSNIIPLVCIL